MEIERVFELVRGDPAGLSDEAVGEGLAACGRLASWVCAREAAFVAEGTRRSRCEPDTGSGRGGSAGGSGTGSGSGRGAEDELKDKTGASGRDARKRARRAKGLDRLAVAAAALADGDITAEHASLLAEAHGEMPLDVEAAEAELVAMARTSTVDGFRKALAEWKREHTSDDGESELDAKRQRRGASVFDTDDGMVGLFAALDPIAGAEVRRALEWHVDRLWRAQRNSDKPTHLPRSHRKRLYADAVVEMARLSMNPTTVADDGVPEPAPPHASVVAVISINWLLGRLDQAGFSELADGTPVPVSVLRQLAAHVGIIPMVMDTDGTVLDMGRRSRTATDDQRLALLVRDGACANPGCDATDTTFTHAHHITQWADGGPTDLANLLNQCLDDHHHIHDRAWTITQHQDHTWWLHRPDRTPHQPLHRRRPPPDTG